MPDFGPSHIEKLSGDNRREEKERVMVALRTGWAGGKHFFGVIHHLISGIADCSSALSALAWEVTYQISG